MWGGWWKGGEGVDTDHDKVKYFAQCFQKYMIHWVLFLSHCRDRGVMVGRGCGERVTDPTNIQDFAQGFQKYMIHGMLTIPYYRDRARGDWEVVGVTDPKKVQDFAQCLQNYMVHGVLTLPNVRILMATLRGLG